MKVHIRIKDLAQRKGIDSVYRLARRLNVTDTRARQLWNSEGFSSISVKTIELICEEFDCTPNDFIVVTKGKKKA